MIFMEFPEKLQKLLAQRGMKQAELARAIGTYPSRISEWVNREGKPSVYQVLRAARALSVPMEFLADDEMDEPAPREELSEDDRALLTVARAMAGGPREAARTLIAALEARASLVGGKSKDQVLREREREREQSGGSGVGGRLKRRSS